MSSIDTVAALHATLVRRDTPETVAKMVLDALPDLQAPTVLDRLRRILGLPPRSRFDVAAHQRFGWSSMAMVFRTPDPVDRQLNKARELAHLFLGETLPEGADAQALDNVARELNRLIHKTPGKAGFRDDRLSAAARRGAGLTLSRRRYDKLFRLVGRLERKSVRLAREEEKFDLVLAGKAALAPRLTLEDFAGDLPGAAFVAYYAARMKLRSEFTIDGQQKPFDDFAAALLDRCDKGQGTSWWAIAHVFPRADVLARLTDEQKGRLLGQWFEVLQTAAGRLAEAHRMTNIDLESMIVRRGNDSSTWNLLAAAFNRARDHWIALLDAMGADALLDAMMPGKVMRLMAGDVAGWHRSTGGGVHPDTRVWRRLPPPWAVLTGEQECGRRDIVAACLAEGVNPASSRWTRPRARKAVAAFRPTPELVHGVSVSNPYFATWLRKAGAFSGKPMTI
ncbi:MAG: hypothetical protein EON96_13405 [Caulobacteraceae bacterium]|nr:MAG: hypothetical protein EON96_13405 [Caulobacteraceae bacterium]